MWNLVRHVYWIQQVLSRRTIFFIFVMIFTYKWKELGWVVKWHLIMPACVWEFLKTISFDRVIPPPTILLYKWYIDDIFYDNEG